MADMTDGNGAGEEARLQARLRELEAENERLKKELERAGMERDSYLQALNKVAPEIVFTEADVKEFMENGVPAHEVLAAVEEIVRKGA
jgi:hypothetical protein